MQIHNMPMRYSNGRGIERLTIKFRVRFLIAAPMLEILKRQVAHLVCTPYSLNCCSLH